MTFHRAMHAKGSSRILRAILVAISMSAAAPSSTAAAPVASPAVQGSAMRSLSEHGLAILLRMGCSARIKTHHGRYIACGDIVGAMAEATAQDCAEAATFWVQEVAKERPQECVFAVDLHAPVKAGGVASFLKITGNGDEGLAMCTTKDQTSAPIRLAWSNNNGPHVGLQETQGPSKRYLCAHKSGKFGLKDHARNFERYEMSIYSASTKATPGKKPEMAPAQPSSSSPSSGDGDWVGLWDACVSATASLGVDVSLKSRHARDQDVTLKSGGTLVVGGESRSGIKLAAASEFGKLCLVDASTGKFLLVDKHGKMTEQDKPCGGGDLFEAHVAAEAVDSAMEKRAPARSSVLWPASAPAKPSGKGKGGKGAVAPSAGEGSGDAADDVASSMKKMSLENAEGEGGGKGGGKGNKKGGKKGAAGGGAGQKEGGKGKRLTYDQKVKQATENFVVKGKNKGGKGNKGANAAPVPTPPAAKEKKENPLSKLPDPKDAAHSGNDGSKPESAAPSTGGGGMSSTLGSSSSSAVTCDGCRIALNSVKMAGGQTKYTYRDHNGKKLCEACWTNVAPRCARCNLAVTGTVTTALKRQWHPECLKCEGCKAQLQATFYLLDHKPNVPYCSFCIKGIEQSEQAARDRRRGGLQQPGGAAGNVFAMGGAAGIVGGGSSMLGQGGSSFGGGSPPMGGAAGGGGLPTFGKLGKRLD